MSCSVLHSGDMPSAHLDGEQCLMCEDEERSTIRAAEDKLNRSLWYINFRDLAAIPRIYEDLPIGNIHIPILIDGHALTTSLCERLQFSQCSVRRHSRSACKVFRFAAHVDLLSWLRNEKTIGIKVIAEPPA